VVAAGSGPVHFDSIHPFAPCVLNLNGDYCNRI
jgi:hypothetical protein